MVIQWDLIIYIMDFLKEDHSPPFDGRAESRNAFSRACPKAVLNVVGKSTIELDDFCCKLNHLVRGFSS